MKKLLIFVVSFLMVFTVIVPVSAQESNDTYIYYLSENEVEANLNEDFENIIESLSSTKSARIPEYSSYKYEEQTPVYRSVSGWAGNCPVGGVQYPKGGMIYWNPNGGPSVSVSLGVSYGNVSIGLSLGVRSDSTTAYLTEVPAGNNYYRLWVEPTYKIVPTKVYGKKVGSSSYTYLYTIYPKSIFRAIVDAKKVG